MANNCATLLTITDDRKQGLKLHKNMKNMYNKADVCLGSAWSEEMWFGNMISALGGDPKEVYCRGSIVSFDLLGDRLVIQADSAWSEIPETWEFVQQALPDIVIRYSAEEHGCGYWVTNDHEGLYYDTEYFFQAEDWSDEYSTLEEFLEVFNEETGAGATSFEEAEKYCLHARDVYVLQVEYVNTVR